VLSIIFKISNLLTGSILFNLSDGVIEGVIEGVEDKIVEADRDVLRQ